MRVASVQDSFVQAALMGLMKAGSRNVPLSWGSRVVGKATLTPVG